MIVSKYIYKTFVFREREREREREKYIYTRKTYMALRYDPM
jgi:hypothetical protein